MLLGSSPLVCEEWVSAIRSAVKGFSEKDLRTAENEDVLVNLVSLRSKSEGTDKAA
jgi:hypothetical protein